MESLRCNNTDTTKTLTAAPWQVVEDLAEEDLVEGDPVQAVPRDSKQQQQQLLRRWSNDCKHWKDPFHSNFPKMR